MQPKFSKNFTYDLIYQTEMKPYATNLNGKPDWKTIEQNLKKYGPIGTETYHAMKPGMLYKAEIEPELKKDATWPRILRIIKKQKAGKGEEFLVGASIIHYLNAIDAHEEKDLKNFLQAARLYAETYPTYLMPRSKNDWAWAVFQKSNDKDELNTGILWIKSALKDEPKNANMIDTYANLLYKLGKKEEAIKLEEEALSINPDSEEIKIAYDKMKRNEKTW